MPLPFSIGITDVDAVLKDITRPSEVNGALADGKLFW